jgi:hypothetical protein
VRERRGEKRREEKVKLECPTEVLFRSRNALCEAL